MVSITNQEIRNRMKETGVRQWEIAEKLRINESVLSRKLRHELSTQDREKILLIIDKLEKEKGGIKYV